MDEMNTVNTPVSEEKPKKKTPLIVTVYDWLEVVCFAAVLVVLIFTFVGRMATVSGSSMIPTLSDGDRLVITNLFYTPERYDIVVVQKESGYYKDNGELLVKRVIAKGGETIQIDFDTWTVAVDGVILHEPYIKKVFGVAMKNGDLPEGKAEIVVEEGCYFVMGDNRNGSSDSRYEEVGFVKESEIIGKAIFRVSPFSDFGPLG